MNAKHHVYVAMSGGVDSAVAAAKLLEQGYAVTGIHMQTWQDPKWQAQIKDLPPPGKIAETSANALGIPFVLLDIREKFYQSVVKRFLHQYLNGLTPNPCLFCNPQVKWGILQSYGLEQGADYFATGHYARIEWLSSRKVRLLRGVDQTKDQSYVLSMLSQFQLSHSLLPLGDMTKEAVRAQARALSLPVADQQDSQDLCFLGNIDYRDFLLRFSPESFERGEIIDTQGRVLGEHGGLALYTIGQRKGIRIAAAEPYFVIDKDVENNRLVVGFAEQTGKKILLADHPRWISGTAPEVGRVYEVMIRYRAKREPAVLVMVTEAQFRLEFKKPLRGITPGQVAVLYRGEECLGGGIIQSFA
ncbi:MAG: tRNA 2-thiouridine(34) synthase MnmA [Chloroflexota bacterium]|nr:tRNA 2-thiouridine(34) synthase MnmA [Chloroflexota bacterium]